MVSAFMYTIFGLLFVCFLKFVFSLKYCKCAIITGISYGTCNCPAVYFFANKHDHTNNKEW